MTMNSCVPDHAIRYLSDTLNDAPDPTGYDQSTVPVAPTQWMDSPS